MRHPLLPGEGDRGSSQKLADLIVHLHQEAGGEAGKQQRRDQLGAGLRTRNHPWHVVAEFLNSDVIELLDCWYVQYPDQTEWKTHDSFMSLSPVQRKCRVCCKSETLAKVSLVGIV